MKDKYEDFCYLMATQGNADPLEEWEGLPSSLYVPLSRCSLHALKASWAGVKWEGPEGVQHAPPVHCSFSLCRNVPAGSVDFTAASVGTARLGWKDTTRHGDSSGQCLPVPHQEDLSKGSSDRKEQGGAVCPS